MKRVVIEDGKNGGVLRGNINLNFLELYKNKAENFCGLFASAIDLQQYENSEGFEGIDGFFCYLPLTEAVYEFDLSSTAVHDGVNVVKPVSEIERAGRWILKTNKKADLINGKVPVYQLPSYVSKNEEYATFNDFPIVGDSSTVYIALDTRISYRWSGTIYSPIPQSIALGETENTAFAGNKGKEAYDLKHNHSNKAALDVLMGVNSGDEDVESLSDLVESTEATDSISDDDSIVVYKNSISLLVRTSFAVLKSVLKTYFDTLYNKYIHPNHTGDVTSNSDGATTITAKSVTLAKMADVANGSIFYRRSTGSGIPELQTLATLKEDIGIVVLKGVLGMVNTLPVEGMNVSDRYFMLADELFMKIAEWNGLSWDYTNTVNGNLIYDYSYNRIIVRLNSSYSLFLSKQYSEVLFTEATEVTITHNFGYYPNVTIIDSSNRSFAPDYIDYSSTSRLTVAWTGATSGKVICS